jgi:rhomboid protease GluP
MMLRLSDEQGVIRAIIYLNIAMYVISLLLNPRTVGISLNPLTALSPSNGSLLLIGATGTIPIDELNRWWSLISANYLHGGILHIFFNMAALSQVGPLIAREYGTWRMISIYTLSGIAGFVVSYLAGVGFTIGASAALCGLLGAALYFGKSVKGPYGGAVYRQIGGWVVGLAIFGLIVPGINNWGHGGGLAAGMAIGWLSGYSDAKRQTIFHQALAAVCVAATIIVLAWATGSALYYLLR